MNSPLKQVIEGNIERMIEMKRKRGIRHEQLPNDLKEKRGHYKWKEEALDRTMWRNRFGRCDGFLLRQLKQCINLRYKKLVNFCVWGIALYVSC